MDPCPRIRLLDGATGTNLFAAGMPQGCCVEEWILEHPQVLIDLQKAFVAAGSDILYAPTFSANRAKLQHFGLQDKVAEFNHRLVALSRQAAEGRPVFGDLSPTGLFVEPFGEATFDELVSIYAEQAQALNEAGVDGFVIETTVSLVEARAAVLACRGYGKDIYVTITVNEKGRTLSGATAASALTVLQPLGITAFGLNCCFGPAHVAEELATLREISTVPLIGKPNAGVPHGDGSEEHFSPEKMAEEMVPVLEAGATLIGGCCGSTPAHVAALRNLLDARPEQAVCAEEIGEEILVAIETGHVLLDPETLQLSEPISCSLDMSDELLDLEDSGCDVIAVEVDTLDDAHDFSLNAHFARLPICFVSNDPEVLRRALYLYCGRPLVDRRCAIEEEVLRQICDEYGAVLY